MGLSLINGGQGPDAFPSISLSEPSCLEVSCSFAHSPPSGPEAAGHSSPGSRSEPGLPSPRPAQAAFVTGLETWSRPLWSVKQAKECHESPPDRCCYAAEACLPGFMSSLSKTGLGGQPSYLCCSAHKHGSLNQHCLETSHGLDSVFYCELEHVQAQDSSAAGLRPLKIGNLDFRSLAAQVIGSSGVFDWCPSKAGK